MYAAVTMRRYIVVVKMLLPEAILVHFEMIFPFYIQAMSGPPCLAII